MPGAPITIGGDGRIRTADRGFADLRLNHLATSPLGAEDGIRTRDLLLGKEMCYHCTTSALVRVRGLEPPREKLPSSPSSWRVYLFRHTRYSHRRCKYTANPE